MNREDNTAVESANNEFLMTRIFDASRELVFNAWTERERLMQWWGPKGFTMHTCNIDLSPGGVFHYGMRAPDGSVMWGKWVFREIVRPERLVFVASFSDEAGGVTRHPWAPDWPLKTLSTLRFDEHEGRTKLTAQGIPQGASELERKTFDAGRESMRQGWSGTLDQLAQCLARA
jgi:uncharacterized protein YndB with AHSA1/START domain